MENQNILNIFWEKIEYEIAYNRLNVSEKFKEIIILNIDSIKKIVFWRKETIDINTINEKWNCNYWIIFKDIHDTKQLIKLILENIDIDKLDDQDWDIIPKK